VQPALSPRRGKTIVDDIPVVTEPTLVEAMIATSDTPLVLLDGDLNVVIASNSFCDAFELHCDALIGRPLLEMDAHAAKAMTAQLLADKLLLNRELQHRVANSLQIIASVLMQSARRAGSDESRDHLHNAHSRVLSIAAVQKQLAESGAESVNLRPYLTQLCASIAASMIPDPEKLSIVVEADGSEVGSEESISLGLIVTELVINALKHAFPDDHAGKIVVRYSGDGDAWQLEVADDGVGMPPHGTEAATPGLGTSIVEALVRQRGARITVSAAHPGTLVSIRHQAATSKDAKIVSLQRAV